MHAPSPSSAGSQHNHVQPSNVYQFSKKREARLIHIIEQATLDELLARRAEAREAQKKADDLEQYISIALRSGAQIEQGLRTAEFVRIERRKHHVRGGSFTKLIVK